MRIEGNLAFLTPEEIELTNYPSPLEFSEDSLFVLMDELQEDIITNTQKQMSDNLSGTERIIADLREEMLVQRKLLLGRLGTRFAMDSAEPMLEEIEDFLAGQSSQ